MLYHRRQVQLDNRANQQWRNYLRTPMGDNTLKHLDHAITLIETRLDLMDNVLSDLNTAIVVYDLFGRVVTVNKKLSTFAEKHRIDMFASTALDLITSISGLSADESLDMLRTVLMEDSTFSLPVVIKGESQNYVLSITPLLSAAERQNQQRQLAFQQNGFVFELVDVSNLKRLGKLKEELVEKLNYQLRHDMEALVMSVGLLAKPELSAQQRQRVTTILQEKVSNTVTVMTSVHEYIQFEVDVLPIERYPVDPLKILRRTLENLSTTFSAKDISITETAPNFISLVLAEPHHLANILKHILHHLIDDATTASIIHISIEEDTEMITMELANEGFGIPEERLQKYLTEKMTENNNYYRFQEARRLLQQWQGDLTITSAMGKGFHFYLRFKGVI